MMRFFATPRDAEVAFYEALEQIDIDAMMRIWAEDEEVICVHPQGGRSLGYTAVREAWQRAFAQGTRASVRITDVVRRQGILLATHSMHEHYAVAGEVVVGETLARPPVIATHVYVHGAQGWHLLARHASSAPAAAVDAASLH